MTSASRCHIFLPFFLRPPGKGPLEPKFRNASMKLLLLAPRSWGSFCFWRRLSLDELGEEMRDLYQWTFRLHSSIRPLSVLFILLRSPPLAFIPHFASPTSPLSSLTSHHPSPIIRQRSYIPRLPRFLLAPTAIDCSAALVRHVRVLSCIYRAGKGNPVR